MGLCAGYETDQGESRIETTKDTKATKIALNPFFLAFFLRDLRVLGGLSLFCG
jgi:hypothetical protein